MGQIQHTKRRQCARQGSAAGVANVPPQRLRTEVPGAAAEPTLLPRSGMPEGVATLAGGQASAETPRRGGRAPAACRGGTAATPTEGRTRTKAAKESQVAATTAEKPARGHAGENHPASFLRSARAVTSLCGNRPCAAACYCGDECRTAVNRVLDRERKVLAA